MRREQEGQRARRTILREEATDLVVSVLEKQEQSLVEVLGTLLPSHELELRNKSDESASSSSDQPSRADYEID